MIIKRLICGVSFLLAAQTFPSFAAEPSSVYQYYLSEGIKAFESHNDEDASRYFAWAREIDPSAKEPEQYAKALTDRQRFEAEAGDRGAVYYPYLKEMIQKGKDAMGRQDYTAAKQYFYTAHLLDRDAPEPLEYLNLVKRLSDGRTVVEKPVLDQPVPKKPVVLPEPTTASQLPVPQQKTIAVSSASSSGTMTSELDRLEKRKRSGSDVIRIPGVKDKNKPVEVISIDEVLQHAVAGRALLKIDLGASLILEGKNIQKFLVVTEDPVVVKLITHNQIQIDARRIGATFIHIWDDIGRRTIYVEIVFPAVVGGDAVEAIADVEHAAPFKINYYNDWNSYYLGNNISGMKRRSVYFQQGIGIAGATPYGYFDASGQTIGWHQMLKFLTYTTGLSGIPAPGVSDFNVRFFDAFRHLTPLTFPGSSLRGAYADVNIFKDVIGLSVTHGRETGTFGYFSQGRNVVKSAYVDAGKVLLFPKDPNKHYSFNYARGFGDQRQSGLTKDVYSVEGKQRTGRATWSGELAQDDDSRAGLAGVRWDEGTFHTALNMRNTGKTFTTVTGSGSDQGVVGATWTTDSMIHKAGVSTMLDVYKNHILYNPLDPNAFNYSANAQASAPLNDVYTLEGNLNYSDTSGELSPRTYAGAGARLKRLFDVWGGRKGNAYIGSSWQKSRFAFLPTAEYDRHGALAGVYLPLNRDLSFNGNYEYSWLTEPFSGDSYNPNVLMLGLSYYKQISEKLSGNMGLNYRREDGFGGTNSFLSGEDSLGYTTGLSYNPTKDVTLFFDARLNNVWGKMLTNTSYNDMDLRAGLRSNWGTGFSWDPSGTIEGVAFKDKNKNAKFDKGEEGIPGVKIKIGDKEAVTDAQGWYHMAVKAKRVMVSAVADSVPAGYIFSTPTFTRVLVRHGLRDRVNFGLTTRSGIYGVIFVDKNGDGTPGPGDEFVGRVRILLDGKPAQVSDPQGAYFISDVSPGKHVLTLDIKSLPVKYIPLIKLQNEIHVTEGTTYLFHIPMKLKE